MGKPTSSRTAFTDAAWFRWLLVLTGMAVWLGITVEFPLYFQRDEVQMMNWVNSHSILDGFIPTPECGFSHDTAYRPLLYSYWWILYKLFGLNFDAFYLLTGVLFVSSMALLFKLVNRLSDSRSAHLSVLVWLGAFQFLMTVLFWVTEQGYLLMMILTLSGLLGVVTGLGTSRGRVIAGCIPMLASFLIWEPLALILPTTVAVFIATRAGSLGWGLGKTALASAAALVVGPAYWIGVPFGRQRMESSGASLIPSAADVASRFSYYMGHLFSGITGMVLLVPAVYCILSLLLVRTRLRAGVRVPVSLVAAVVVSVVVVKMHLLALGMVLALAAGLVLPRVTWMLLPMVGVPIAGLLAFAEPSRTYLFLPSYAMAALAGMQMDGLWTDACDWWTARVTRPAMTYAFILLALVLAAVPVSHKVQSQVALLRLRSNITQNVRWMTPHLKRLPRGASVVVVDYASMGFRFGQAMLRWTDREKLLYQAPVDSTKAQFWFSDIGRHDLRKVLYRDYAKTPRQYHEPGPVYIWLQTPKDHEFFAKQALASETVARVQHGDTSSTLLLLGTKSP